MKPQAGMPTGARREMLAAATSLRRNCSRKGLHKIREANKIASRCAFFQRNRDDGAGLNAFDCDKLYFNPGVSWKFSHFYGCSGRVMVAEILAVHFIYLLKLP